MSLKKLEAEARKINSALYEARNKEKQAEAKKFVGKYFRYRNNYSLPKTAKDYWYIYFRVLRVDSMGMVVCLRVQRDKNGVIEINSKYHTYPHHLGEQITRKQYVTAVNDIMEKSVDIFDKMIA
jgi:hypothetical protein